MILIMSNISDLGLRECVITEANTAAPVPPLVLDHLTILSRSFEVGAAFYGLILPQLGFSQLKPGIWCDANGLHFQIRAANGGTRGYER